MKTKNNPASSEYAFFCLASAAPELLDICEKIVGELGAWRSSGLPRPAAWTESRINRLNAVISKAYGHVSVTEIRDEAKEVEAMARVQRNAKRRKP